MGATGRIEATGPVATGSARVPAVLRRLLRAAGLAAWALVLLVVFALSAYLAFNQWIRRGVTTVPELAGLSEEEVPPGRVIESRPRAGSFVKRGAPIEGVVSLGARRVAVPDLAGKAIPAAQLMLRSEGLEPGTTLGVLAAAGAPGTVVGQDPPSGASAPAGTSVDLLVALETAGATFVMPDLIYRRYEPVRRAFEAAGFRFGAVTFEPYEGISEGTILRQGPLPGHPLRRSDALSLVVAAPAEMAP